MKLHRWTNPVGFTYQAGELVAARCSRCGANSLNANEECKPVEGPYPGCPTPFTCNQTGRCPKDPVCFN